MLPHFAAVVLELPVFFIFNIYIFLKVRHYVFSFRALRSIENAPFSDHTDPLFREQRIIKSDKIYTLNLLITHKSVQLGKLDKFLDLEG